MELRPLFRRPTHTSRPTRARGLAQAAMRKERWESGGLTFGLISSPSRSGPIDWQGWQGRETARDRAKLRLNSLNPSQETVEPSCPSHWPGTWRCSRAHRLTLTVRLGCLSPARSPAKLIEMRRVVECGRLGKGGCDWLRSGCCGKFVRLEMPATRPLDAGGYWNWR